MLEENSVIDEVATSEEIIDDTLTEAVEETVEETTEEPTTEEIAKPQQSAEENSKFAEIRRKYEEETRKSQNETRLLTEALKKYGYDGSPDEIADKLLSESEGITPEEARAIREREESIEAEKKATQSELQMYKSLAIEKLMEDDLKKIQSVYPEVKSLNELGEDFLKAMSAADRDPIIAYEVIKLKKDREIKKPPEIGGVNQSSQKEKDFYTSAEVDKLTDKDYDNPKIMEIVRKSMSKWK